MLAKLLYGYTCNGWGLDCGKPGLTEIGLWSLDKSFSIILYLNEFRNLTANFDYAPP